MQTLERKAIPQRIAEAKEYMNKLEAKERELQKRYFALKSAAN
jgi:hypothetical protein